MEDMLQAMREAMASLPKRKEWGEMSAGERLAEAIHCGAEVRVSDMLEPGTIAAHKRSTFLPGYHQPSDEYVVYVSDEALRQKLLAAVPKRGTHG